RYYESIDQFALSVMPDVIEKRVWDEIKCKFWKRNKVEPDTAKKVKVVVTRGRIEIISIENKFSPVHIKPSDMEIPPKLPRGATTWCILDIIKNVEAKYKSVNFQVSDPSEMESFVNTLKFAWDPMAISFIFRDSDLIQPIAPVHRPSPNAPPTRITTLMSRHERNQVRVDQDDGVHPSFQSEFKGQKRSHQKATDVMKGMFDDYGITEEKGELAVPVHTLPSNVQQKNKGLEKPKTSVPGLDGISFYGQSKRNTNNQPSVEERKAALKDTSANRVSTKDSLDSAPPPSSLRILSTLPEEPENGLPSQTYPKNQQSPTGSPSISQPKEKEDSIPWYRIHANQSNPPSPATTIVQTPTLPAAMAPKRPRLEDTVEVNERKEKIEKELSGLAEEINKLDSSESEDLMEIVKTLVMSTVERKLKTR
ncbi:hypothetical protein PFISCL1PPCAC_10905, partial [Pristionchus fissidentatus]